MRPVAIAFLFVGSCAAQWVTGYHEMEGETSMPVSEVPWTKITHGIEQNSVINVDCTIDTSGMDDPATFVANGHAAGKTVLFSLMNPSANFTSCITAGNRASFVSGIMAVISAFGFDGVDLDYEAWTISASDYGALIDDLYTQTSAAGKIITAAVFQDIALNNTMAAKHAKLAQVNVMCYDMDSGYGSPAGGLWYNGALTATGNPWGYQGCDLSVKSFTDAGVPASKIGVGRPAYARLWSGGCTTLGQTGCTIDGTFWHYYDVLASADCLSNYYYDSTYKANYCTLLSGKWVSFSGPESMAASTEWMSSQGYGGIMILALGYDYVEGAIGDAKHPLTSSIYADLFESAATFSGSFSGVLGQ